jgi:hypothetical protein
MALTDNLQSYWKLDGNSNDAVGSNNGSDTDITYSSGNGKINQGAGFNGSSSKIVLADIGNYTSAITVQCWAKLNDVTSDLPLVIKPYTSLDAPYVQWGLKTQSGSAYFQVAIGGQIKNASGGTLSTGIWYHIVGTYDGTNLKVYVNGTAYTTAETGSLNTYSTNVEIGHYVPGSTFTNGSIDEVGIWNRALSTTEVGQLYNSGNGLAYPLSTETTITLSGETATWSAGGLTTKLINTLNGSILNWLSGVITGVSKWTMKSKNTTSWSNKSKNSTIWTEETKNSTSWTNKTKS